MLFTFPHSFNWYIFNDYKVFLSYLRMCWYSWVKLQFVGAMLIWWLPSSFAKWSSFSLFHQLVTRSAASLFWPVYLDGSRDWPHVSQHFRFLYSSFLCSRIDYMFSCCLFSFFQVRWLLIFYFSVQLYLTSRKFVFEEIKLLKKCLCMCELLI